MVVSRSRWLDSSDRMDGSLGRIGAVVLLGSEFACMYDFVLVIVTLVCAIELRLVGSRS